MRRHHLQEVLHTGVVLIPDAIDELLVLDGIVGLRLVCKGELVGRGPEGVDLCHAEFEDGGPGDLFGAGVGDEGAEDGEGDVEAVEVGGKGGGGGGVEDGDVTGSATGRAAGGGGHCMWVSSCLLT